MRIEGNGQKITRKQEHVIAALLTCQSIGEAAQQCQVAETSIHRWLKDDAFQMAYREARRAVVQQVIGQVMQASGQAIETLCAVMQNVDAPANARVSAAKIVLETAIKAVELEDLEVRITTLEAHIGVRA